MCRARPPPAELVPAPLESGRQGVEGGVEVGGADRAQQREEVGQDLAELDVGLDRPGGDPSRFSIAFRAFPLWVFLPIRPAEDGFAFKTQRRQPGAEQVLATAIVGRDGVTRNQLLGEAQCG